MRITFDFLEKIINNINMVKKKENKVLKTILIISGVLVLCVGITLAIIFATRNNKIHYYQVELSENSGEITINTNVSSGLAPDYKILNAPVFVNLSTGSSNSYVRAKIIFESDSDDDRVLSFISQMNYYIAETETKQGTNYSWQYYAEDNSFYLMNDNRSLRMMSPKDNRYVFVENIVVPSKIEQITFLNVDEEGNEDNVQIGEKFTLKIIFEAVQSEIVSVSTPTIEKTREYFNNISTKVENGYTSENGFITSCSLTDTNLQLPKYVGEDYIIGIKKDAFASSNLQNVIIPANYIYIEQNAFSGANNLKSVILKNYLKMDVEPFAINSIVTTEIYANEKLANFLKEEALITTFKTYTEVLTGDLNEISKDTVYLYAPNVTEFTGSFSEFTSLKYIFAPNLTKVNDNMFKNVSSLIYVEIPNVKEVGASAFYGCGNLLGVSLNKNLKSIGANSFFSCSNLLNANFVKNLAEIPQEAFRNCSSISQLNFNADGVKIGNSSFYNCSKLRFVYVNKTNEISPYAFANCPVLRYVRINQLNNANISENCLSASASSLVVLSNYSDYDSFISSNASLQSKAVLLSIKDGVLNKYLGNIASLNLTEFNAYEKIIKIGALAFKDISSINAITLSSSVSEIESNAFENLENLTSITFTTGLVPTIAKDAFVDLSDNLKIYVPNASLNLYKESLKDFNLTILSE